MPICTECKQDLKDSDFYTYKLQSGKTKLHKKCRTCHNPPAKNEPRGFLALDIDVRQQIIAAHKLGLSTKKIATKFGVAPANLYAWIKKGDLD